MCCRFCFWWAVFFVVSNKGNFLASVKMTAAIVFVIFLCTFMGLALGGEELLKPLEAYAYCADKHTGGGILGGTIAYYLAKAFGIIGSYIIDIIVLIVCMVLITERSALKGMKKGGQKVYESAKESNEKYREYREYKSNERRERRMDRKVSGVSIDTKIEDKKAKRKKSDEMGEIHIEGAGILPEVKEERKVPVSAGEIIAPSPVEPQIAGDFMPDSAVPESIAVPSEAVPDMPKEEPAVSERTKKKAHISDEDMQREVENVAREMAQTKTPRHKYVFPKPDLLKTGSGKKAGNTEHDLRETANKLQQTLQTFGVKRDGDQYQLRTGSYTV